MCCAADTNACEKHNLQLVSAFSRPTIGCIRNAPMFGVQDIIWSREYIEQSQHNLCRGQLFRNLEVLIVR